MITDMDSTPRYEVTERYVKSHTLRGNTDSYVNIRATDDSYYVLGPLQIYDNTVQFNAGPENNNEYTFTITRMDGTTMLTDEIVACKDKDGKFPFEMRYDVPYYDSTGKEYHQDVSVIPTYTDVYLKVKKNSIDEHKGIDYIKAYNKINYTFIKNVSTEGWGKWRKSGYQDIASPINIETKFSEQRTSGQDTTWLLSYSGIAVRKIDKFDGASDNVIKKLDGIELVIKNERLGMYLMFDTLGNYEGATSNINDAGILVTDENGIAYIKGSHKQRYIVGLDQGDDPVDKPYCYRVYETKIPETPKIPDKPESSLCDYYNPQNKKNNGCNVLYGGGEYSRIHIGEGCFLDYTAKNYRDYERITIV